MSRKGLKPTGPTPLELKLKSDLDRARRELAKLKKAMAAPANGSPADAVAPEALEAAEPDVEAADEAVAPEVEAVEATNGHAEPEALPAPAVAAADTAALEQEIEQLRRAKQRVSKLYYQQVEENRKRAAKLHQILENLCDINAGFDLDTLLTRLADHIRQSLGFRAVLIRLRDPGSRSLKARAFAGLDDSARTEVDTREISVDEFMSWLHDDCKVSRSYLIRHDHALSAQIPRTPAFDLGPREPFEWHAHDALLVPLFSATGELVGYFSVDDPADRLVPSREVIELLEIYGNHAVVAIENARLYRQLERHTRELEQAGQHMQELHALKSNFVSTVSHELRTPLTAIRAYTETLMNARAGEMAEAQVQRFLSIINEESQRLARLIESVLDLNRFDSGTAQLTRQPVDLAELLQEAAPVLESLAQVGSVTLKLEVGDADTRVEANRDQMRQLVLHLGSNAVKFTPPGGQVTLRLHADAHDVVLQVEDTGIGIPADKLEKVFERFYQVDSSLARKFGGTGLGLAICKSIVDWHGGLVHADSEEGRGSRFTVTLPRRSAPRVLVRPGPRPQAATEDVLKLAIEMVAEVMNARVVSLLSSEPDGELVIRAAIGLDPDVVQNARIRPGSGVAGWVAENRRPVCVSGLEPRSEVEGSRRRQYRSGTFLSVPLEGTHGMLGVLNVTEPLTQKTFDAEDCHLLLHLAQRVASAWEQALGMERSQADVGSTAEALREVLKHLERGRRDAPDRVRLSRAVARELKLGESEAGVISFAASVHDVGMGSIGERLVESAGGLSRDERDQVERHPEIGAELLAPLETVGVVRDIVLSHHEWYDGTGYPRGLKGDEISIGARILAVVDAFESMTVGRAHRPPVQREEALAELRRLRGRQFDPAVVDAFERALAAVERSGVETDWSTPTTTDRG
jgi:signal transduction histidine kinase/response regulator RpfG family c-di-GMP phosphodiesterase